MKKRSEKSDKEINRNAYDRAYAGDLVSYSGMYGDSFFHKINLLGQLIHDNHHPSLGVYKEKLLREAISKFLPKRYEIGTGFVLFPAQNPKVVNGKILWGHTVSSQLDIVIYDSFDFPPVFRDDDFVVLRPESVRVIIEVKGSIDRKQLTNTLEKLWDYSKKWHDCNTIYSDSLIRVPSCPVPLFLVMGWMKSVDTKGRFKINGKSARELIANFYCSKLNPIWPSFLPHLDSLFIYNDFAIEFGSDGTAKGVGYRTKQGKFRIINEIGQVELSGDKTISEILNKIFDKLDIKNNILFSSLESGYAFDELQHEFDGFSEIFGSYEEYHASIPY